ncbi:MAG: ribonuclease J [Defluviitaleaceae bacterium]|nr:ribonuclease J [Defluviitaleaceae bacterium]
MASKKTKLKVFALGGLQEIGKNLTVYEYGADIIVVDCGVAFPEDDMLGIDLVIPDFSYLINNKSKVRAVILTHGHEDHIGAVPFLFRELNCPIYATKLTLGLLEIKLKEHHMLNTVKRKCVSPGEHIKLGHFDVEFIAVTHSIADSVALAIKCPAALCVHTGDFNIDHTPVHGVNIDLQRFAQLGKDGVDLLLCDSTNVEASGFTMSERSVGAVFEDIFDDCANRRIMVATFSSNIHRIQQVINCAVKHDRKVAVVGRSMLNTVTIAQELGYLSVPERVFIDITEVDNYTDGQIAIITTGTQGETMSALSRMASSDHRQLEIKPGDKIIISASSIPGNEKAITKVIDELFKKGADVIYQRLMEVHVSGHAKQEELKFMHALIKPRFFMPVHGQYRHLKIHKKLAVDLGMDKDDVFVMDNGDVLEVGNKTAKINGTVTSGLVFVDGLGVGDVGNVVLRDRRHLSQDGLIVVICTFEKATGEMLSGPDIISRGFVYVKESEDLMDGARDTVKGILYRGGQGQGQGRRGGKSNGNGSGYYIPRNDWSHTRNIIRDTLREYVWQKTKRRPMILPVIVEV